MYELNIRRLQLAVDWLQAQVIDKGQQHRFDMDDWLAFDDLPDDLNPQHHEFSWDSINFCWPVSAVVEIDGRQVQMPGKEPRCGAVACAIGWIAGHPLLMHEGFLLAVEGSPIQDTDDPPTAVPQWTETQGEDREILSIWHGWAAVERFFGLTCSEAQRLFQANAYEDPSIDNVVARLRRFIEVRKAGSMDRWDD